MTAGLLGRKSGRGFYTYAEEGSAEVVDDAATPRPGRRRRGRPAGPDRRRRRLRHHGHRDHRGRRQGRLRRALRRPRAREGRGGHEGADQVAGQAGRSAASSTRPAATTSWPGSAATTSLDELADRDLVIEAVVESLSVKEALFANLGEIAKPGAVLATTTSSLPVIECAAASGRPADVVGMHFFNPAQVMKLVEVVCTISTAPDVAATAHAVSAKLGKHAVSCTDRAGFIVNALLFPYLNDAVKMLEAHYATADDIDAAMKVGCGYPMGPVRAAGRRRARRLPGHRAGALHRVPRARVRARPAARAPGHRRLPGPQDRPRVPGLRRPLTRCPVGDPGPARDPRVVSRRVVLSRSSRPRTATGWSGR